MNPSNGKGTKKKGPFNLCVCVCVCVCVHQCWVGIIIFYTR
jgi:hypothetical protein